MKKSERAPRRSREQWRGLVAEWKSSGRSARDFAVARDVKVESLQYWSRVLGRDAAARGPKLLPVCVTPAAETVVRSLELVLGPLRVRFEGGTPPSYVAAVAHALLHAGAS
jgi:hypothetical protein